MKKAYHKVIIKLCMKCKKVTMNLIILCHKRQTYAYKCYLKDYNKITPKCYQKFE